MNLTIPGGGEEVIADDELRFFFRFHDHTSHNSVLILVKQNPKSVSLVVNRVYFYSILYTCY